MEKEINGTYGSHEIDCTVFVMGNWYCVEGSHNVNHAIDSGDLTDGVNVELVQDSDCFTWIKPIETLEEFVEAVGS